MAHARRKFFELHANNQSQIAQQALATIQRLYRVEREVAELLPDDRRRIRQEQAKPIKACRGIVRTVEPTPTVTPNIQITRNDRPIQVKKISIDEEKWTIFNSVEMGIGIEMVHDVAIGKDGAVWCTPGVGRYDGKTWRVFTTRDGLDSKGFSVATDKKGNIWVGGKRISRFDGRSWEVYPGNGYQISTIFVDRRNVVWFGTHYSSSSTDEDNAGVLSFDGKAWKTYRKKDGLLSNNVWGMAEDKYGGIWFATGKGLSYYNGQSWKSFPTRMFWQDPEISEVIPNIASGSDGSLWFNVGTRLTRYRNGTWTNFDMSSYFGPIMGIETLFVSQDNALWIGSIDPQNSKALVRFDGENFDIYDEFNAIYDIEQAPTGEFWFAGSTGVYRYQEK